MKRGEGGEEGERDGEEGLTARPQQPRDGEQRDGGMERTEARWDGESRKEKGGVGGDCQTSAKL